MRNRDIPLARPCHQYAVKFTEVGLIFRNENATFSERVEKLAVVWKLAETEIATMDGVMSEVLEFYHEIPRHTLIEVETRHLDYPTAIELGNRLPSMRAVISARWSMKKRMAASTASAGISYESATA